MIFKAFKCKYCGQLFWNREEAEAHDSQVNTKGKQVHRILRISMGKIEYEKVFGGDNPN